VQILIIIIIIIAVIEPLSHIMGVDTSDYDAPLSICYRGACIQTPVGKKLEHFRATVNGKD